jgi:hypothetical protein
MAGRHDKPRPPHSFHANALPTRYHATVSMLVPGTKNLVAKKPGR